MKKLTLEEIGKMAGVSRATVSRVINSYPYITPDVRERVEKVIAQTGFRPNAVARSLVSNRSNIIGLVIPSSAQFVFTDPYFAYVIQGIAQTCNANDLTMSLFLFHELEEERRTIHNVLATGLIDGLIFTADHKEMSFLPLVAEAEMPFVLLGRPTQPNRVSFVDTDNVGGAYMATEHLIKLGRQRIATIATALNTAGDDRMTGYRRALEDFGYPFMPERVAYADFTMDSGYRAMHQLLDLQPDAVFVTSDTMATGALRAIMDRNLRVPDDIAVVGFDDLPPAAHANPPLTTIRQPIKQTAVLAVEMLIMLIQGGITSPQHKILQNELIVRASCGAAQF